MRSDSLRRTFSTLACLLLAAAVAGCGAGGGSKGKVKGKVTSGRDDLKNAKVTAKVIGESAGDKIDMFKYKNKTGYRRRGGHRQKYTTIEVTKIEGPKKAAAKKAAEAAPGEEG